MREDPAQHPVFGTPVSKRQEYKPILVTIICSTLLSAGGCFAYMNIVGFENLGGMLFLLGLGVAAGGVIWLFVTAIIDGSRRG